MLRVSMAPGWREHDDPSLRKPLGKRKGLKLGMLVLRVSMAPDCGFYQVRNREPVLGCHGSRLRDHVVARLRPEPKAR